MTRPHAACDPTTSTFYLASSGSTAEAAMVYGNPGFLPVLGRWDGGTDQIGVYQPDNGKFHLRKSDGQTVSFTFGNGGNGGNWKPIAGDWDGNGYATQGVVHS
ncbi:hypothetical protein ACWEPM_11295 [Streptomyces sp. NPDC004244]